MGKTIAIIPARGGSKRIPKKNIRPFHGKPIIAYSIENAKESGLFDRIIVSTDDEEIAAVALEWGAEIPFLRPKELADDHTGSGEAVDHAIDWLMKNGEKIDYACTIYATAPLLDIKYLLEGYEKLKNSDASRAFACTIMPFPIQRTFYITENGRAKMFWHEYSSARSQDLIEAYQDAGQFYWKKIGAKTSTVAFDEDAIPIVLPRYMVQDIDTPEDWELVEKLYEILKNSNT